MLAVKPPSDPIGETISSKQMDLSGSLIPETSSDYKTANVSSKAFSSKRNWREPRFSSFVTNRMLLAHFPQKRSSKSWNCIRMRHSWEDIGASCHVALIPEKVCLRVSTGWSMILRKESL